MSTEEKNCVNPNRKNRKDEFEERQVKGGQSKREKKCQIAQALFDQGLKNCSNPNCIQHNPQPHTNFNKAAYTWDGFQCRCRQCQQRSGKSLKTIEYETLFKRGLKNCHTPNCSFGDKPQLLSNFHKHKHGKIGFNPRCKACVNARTRRFSRSPKGTAAARVSRQSEARRKVLQKYNQSEKYKAVKRRYYRKKGKQKNRVYNSVRRAHEASAGGAFTDVQWYNLCKFYEFRCLYCQV